MTHEDPKTFDVRTLERKIRKGIITRKDYDKHLKSLPDRAVNAVPIVPSDDDEDDDREG